MTHNGTLVPEKPKCKLNSPGEVNIYLNGVVKKTATVPTGGLSVNTVRILKVGAYGCDKPVASIEIYQRALTTDEVKKSMTDSTTKRIGLI